jgi:hypothetical protein
LSLNTQIAWKDQVFRDIVDQDTHMDDVEPTVGNDDEQQWIEIQSKAQKRLDSKNRSKAVDQQTGLRDAPATPVPGNPMNDSISNLQPDINNPLDTPTPGTPLVQDAPPSPAPTITTEAPRGSSTHLNVPTNDGTHRVNIRWEPPDSVELYEKDKGKLQASLTNILKAMIQTTDGLMYRWESEDLLHFKDVHTMSPSEVRDYMSPVIKCHST